MKKPVRYLWQNDFLTEEALEEAKERYRLQGFRVVTYYGGSLDILLQDELKKIIQNHLDYEQTDQQRSVL